MKNLLQKCFPCICVGFFFYAALALDAKDSLSWRTGENKVDADIQNWDLLKFLERVSSETSWEIYVEPGTSHQVSAKFKNEPTDEALKRLLGKLNFALLPQTNAAPKFLVYRTTMGQATQAIRREIRKDNAKDENLIPNELIVTLSPNSKMTIEELAKLLKAQIVARDDSLRAYRLRFADEEATEEALEKLNSINDVAHIDRNYFMEPQPPALKLPMASSGSPFPLNPTPLNDPNNVVVALIDTALLGLGPEWKDFVLPQISVAGDVPKDLKVALHAYPMAETLRDGLKMADPDYTGPCRVKILPIDVYGMREYTTTYEIGVGINAAVKGGADIINMSLGTSGNSGFLERLVNNVRNNGILLYAAAGNAPITDPTYPAAYSVVNAVTAGRNGEVSDFANRGPFVDIIAPPSNISRYNGSSFLVTGTSTSTAFASGWAACLLQGQKLTPAQVETSIRQTSPFTFSNTRQNR